MDPTSSSPVRMLRTVYSLEEWSNAGSASCNSTIVDGTTMAVCHRIFPSNVRTSINPRPHWSKTSSNADSSTIPSSSGGGEFGRTVYSQGSLQDDYGRDHHGRCFSMWMAGGGFRPGALIGQTDDYGYNITEQPVHIHDLHATLLHCLGLDHEKLTYRYQGRDFRLTDVHGKLIAELVRAS